MQTQTWIHSRLTEEGRRTPKTRPCRGTATMAKECRFKHHLIVVFKRNKITIFKPIHNYLHQPVGITRNKL
jgi:hypothetical protein